MPKVSRVVLSFAACALAAAHCFGQLTPARRQAPISLPDTFDAFRAWTGADVDTFTNGEQLADFLAERAQSLAAASNPKWSAWLKNMGLSESLNLRAWAGARRLEAGDLSAYTEYESTIFNHVLAISKPGRSQNRLHIFPPNNHIFPSALHIDNKSIFWASFEKTIRHDPTMFLSEKLYAIWCFNTDVDQKELIYDLAKNVLLKGMGKKHASPWQDPRFWIIMDWLYSWGTEDDFEKISELLPKGVKTTFLRLYNEAKKLPGFFNSTLTMLPPTPTIKTTQIGQLGEGESKDKNFNIESFSNPVKKFPRLPPYPQEAMRRGIMTELVLEIVYDVEGKPVSCRPQPGPWQAFFAPYGIKHAMGFEFEPGMNAVEGGGGRHTLTMHFQQ